MKGSKSEMETEQLAKSIETGIRRIVKDAIHETHGEGVNHESRSRSSGRSMLPMLFVGGALFALGYMLRDRYGSVDNMADSTSERIQRVTDMTAERTEGMTGGAAERVRETGRMVTERTETMSSDAAERIRIGGGKAGEMSDEAADRIEETGEELADEMEERSEETADRMEESGEEAADHMEEGSEDTDDQMG